MASDLSPEIKKIQETVVGMYSDHPWPLNQNVDKEMGWRLKCLGIVTEDYKDKSVLEMGCGTGQYALWYGKNGAAEVTGIDLSDGSLSIANERNDPEEFGNVKFVKMDILNCDLPDNHFDYSYSVGVLHHTGDPFRGFEQLVRVTKPGGIIVVSLYNKFSRRPLRCKQMICKWLGGDDIEKRVEWGEKLFGGTLKKLDKRYHGLNRKQISYDIFGFPHESLHSGYEVLKWFDKTGVEYKGSFAPLRLRDYFYAFSLPEYAGFRTSFNGVPVMRLIGDMIAIPAKYLHGSDAVVTAFPRPSLLGSWIVQSGWIIFGSRFNCFTISGVKKG
ncbi:MAG: class I SAM-dependent methyltransferase [Proteobacteria bacterium]|nr:class I SAM-dependent methyltransferase [Pseudomonadota bacterium]